LFSRQKSVSLCLRSVVARNEMFVFWIFLMFISFVVHLSLYLYRAAFGCRVNAVVHAWAWA
jgi:hypothetical protein